jgi:hypothetical protein
VAAPAAAEPEPAAAPNTGLRTGLLAERYRLEHRLAGRGSSGTWRGTDDVLARAVQVRTFASGSRLATRAAAAARAASRVGDNRLARVLDADERAVPPYVVTEWPRGASLADKVADGALPPCDAVWLLTEAGAAIAEAHKAGLAHLRLRPDSLWFDETGDVTVTGLAIDAACAGLRSADPERADMRGLAYLLYAALTGYWPGPGRTTLPAAPRTDGRAACPRRLSARIPADIAAVACRALPGQSCCGPPILGLAHLAAELAATAGTDTEPATAAADKPASECALVACPSLAITTLPLPSASVPTEPLGYAIRERLARPTPRPATGRGARRRALVAVAAAVIAAAVIGVAAWLGARPSGTSSPQSGASAHASLLRPLTVIAFGPDGISDGDNPDLAHLAVGTTPGAAWHTDWYATASFGNLQAGTGLLCEMERNVSITDAEVTLGRTPGADVQLRVGGAPVLASLQPVAEATNVHGLVRLVPGRPARGRYVLIWLTRLPPDSSGTFQASVVDIRLLGTA